MGKVSVKDVAKEAGVSVGTVSNALSGTRYVNPETKEKVMSAIEKLNYIPNLNGRYLKTGTTQNIGFFTNSISGQYFCSLLEAMHRQCERLGYTLIIFVTKDSSVIMSNIMGQRLDGVIIYEDTTIRENEIVLFQQEGIKTVFLDREEAGEGISSVLFDSFKAGYQATRHLINLGHRKIMFIECVDEVIDSLRRKEGYYAAMRDCGMEVDESFILQGAFEEEFTFNTIRSFIRVHSNQIPDAFLAGNDLSAIGCIKALQTEGYRVPEDVSVIGFDDIDIAQYHKLTTVQNPIRRQGMLAVETLVNLIKGEEQGSMKSLEGSLIIRESCIIKK